MKIFYYTLVGLLCFAQTTFSQEIRTIDGIGNNLNHPNWGASHTPIVWDAEPAYSDGVSEPSGLDRANARTISDMLFEQNGADMIDPHGGSNFVWAFGQFISHEISMLPDAMDEPMHIELADEDGLIPVYRSVPASEELSPENPRTPVNVATHWIDGSAIYGSDFRTAKWLRTRKGGKLKMSSGNLLPFNTVSNEFDEAIDPSAPEMTSKNGYVTRAFVTGNPNVNNNLLLISLQTIFAREHNRRCDELQRENPLWSDEKLYQEARRYVGALIQNVLYHEWLPSVGIELPRYSGYQDGLNPQITSAFTSAAFSFFPTLIPQELKRLDNYGNPFEYFDLQLKNSFYDPVYVLRNNGISHLLKGMATQPQQKLDLKVVEDIRNLHSTDGTNMLYDMATIQIQKGRERGLADFNTIRTAYGLDKLDDISQLTSNSSLSGNMNEAFGTIDNIDPIIGFLAEAEESNEFFGETMKKIIEEQFSALRDGDRFYYQNDPAFTINDILEIRLTTLSQIIQRNTDIELLQDNVFKATPHDELAFSMIKKNLDVAVFPNPTHGNFNYVVRSEKGGEAEVQLIDSKGRILEVRKVEVTEGLNVLDHAIHINEPNGYYHLKIELNNRTGNTTLLKVDSY